MNKMAEIKKLILDIIFWVALVIGIIMIIWRIFGDSSTDLAIITPFIVMVLMKIWSNTGAIKDVDHQVKVLSMSTKSAFDKVKGDINRIENKLDILISRRRK